MNGRQYHTHSEFLEDSIKNGEIKFIIHADSAFNKIYYFGEFLYELGYYFLFTFLPLTTYNIYFILCSLISTLLIAAFATLIERKVMSSVQRRRGPNKIGLFGIFQPIADGVKLLLKEIIIPSKADLLIFIFTPIYSFVLSLLIWLFIPFSLTTQMLSTPLSLLYVLAISNLAVFGIIFSGWSSNSKYSFLGSLRASSQMISYEIAFSVVWLIIILINGNLDMVNLIYFQTEYVINFIPLLPIYFIFFIIILAETNRAPFDLPEAESELVAGYNVEFSGMGFAFLFLAEYSNIACMSAIITIFFFSNDIGINYLNFIYFGLKVTIHVIIFVVIRATLPRFRYDMVMNIMWKKILLFLIIMFFFYFFLKFILIYTEMYLMLI
uniref:NADH-ubiquinone oxidoreductase chain 1 n=1 Tax=Acrasis kona TaxID=1008807 RepID=A0A0B4MZ02_9EUKA|nr:NADH dehydrogenase subunit 1 [Acrasis kona]AID52029.1 NADH dehydrogenase subunit 1 [Acrasis kona]